MIAVRTETDIFAPIEICFDMARDIGLHPLTVWRHTKEKAIDGMTSGPIGPGQTVTFEATHFLIRQTLSSQVIEFHRPFIFVDEMLQGAFKSLKHIHEFTYDQEQGKTIMVDTLQFEAPYGWIGWVVERLVLCHYMKRFLEDRNLELKRMIEKSI
ncbi:hypothetical protein D3C81_1288740 [compost metagenome]